MKTAQRREIAGTVQKLRFPPKNVLLGKEKHLLTGFNIAGGYAKTSSKGPASVHSSGEKDVHTSKFS